MHDTTHTCIQSDISMHAYPFKTCMFSCYIAQGLHLCLSLPVTQQTRDQVLLTLRDIPADGLDNNVIVFLQTIDIGKTGTYY